MKFFEKLIFVLYPLVLLMMLISSLYEPLNEYIDYTFSIFYWLVLVGLVVGLKNRKLSSKKILKMSLVTSFLGSLLSIFGFSIITEFILRLAFVGWVVGILSSIKEYVNDNVK